MKDKRKFREASLGELLALSAEIKPIVDSLAESTSASVRQFIEQYRVPQQLYFTIAAGSRAKRFSEAQQTELAQLLYPLRVLLERSICDGLISAFDRGVFSLGDIAGKKIFGAPKKQGVSLRYPLSTCAPTKKCAAGCYAHDGQDRDIWSLSRGCRNYVIGYLYESGGELRRRQIDELLLSHVRFAVSAAERFAAVAAADGFQRKPRIRFSHLGEYVSTPEFANNMARCIRELSSGKVQCVVYTRHPDAHLYDPNLFIVNFTLESPDDPRRRFLPAKARTTCSAWEGRLDSTVDVNFLEHHGRSHSSPIGKGQVCPVSDHSIQADTCDAAGCSLCFEPTDG